jgi:ribonuclease HII
MADYAREYPGYGWERNRGYPTPEHIRALDALGLTPIHRRTFSKVRDKLEATVPLPLEMPEPSLSSHTAIS